MKKLLSLLSVLTIIGTTMPTVIAASPHQKQETIKNSDVNYFQINNLKKLIRNKRQNNQKTNILEKINIVIKTKSYIRSAGVIFNNKLYIGSFDHNVYEYDPTNYYNNLGEINDNSDTVILNELNYLNPDLDISLLEIVNKTNISATIKAKNNSNKYFGENKVYYKINQQNKIINLKELIKQAIFFKFRNEYSTFKIKEVNYININNLSFGNVEIARNEDSKLLHTTDFKEACFKKRERINTSSVKKKNSKNP